MSKAPLKRFPVDGTASGAIEGALSELQGLSEEIGEVVDNTPDSLQNSDRYSTLEQTRSDLDSACSTLENVDLGEVVGELACSWTENRRRGISRSVRRDNAVSALQAAVESIQTWLDDEANAEHDERDAAESAVSDIEQAVSEAEGCEFPGQRG